MMKSIVPLLMLPAALSLLGCNRDDPAPQKDPSAKWEPKESDLSGTWKIDAKATIDLLSKDPSVKPNDMERAKKFFESPEAAEIEMRYGNGTMTSTNVPGRTEPIEGIWKVLSKDGNLWTMETTERGKEPERVLFTWIDRDHVSIVEEGKSDPVVLARTN